ncbi:MAG: GNAT family N-acetyltransferase [Clostridiales bacterium]|jgi:ribosomal protein S18 acetylase RimI-like enzyme|nr:GNAT family N-acetyltransferase [Clostridiales bacterium]
MEIKIRKAIKEDAEAFHKVGLASRLSAYAHIFSKEVLERQEAELPRQIKDMPERLKRQSQYYYVAIVDEKVVGSLVVMLSSNYPRYKSLGYADLEAIHVLPEYQGMGIGRKFFNAATKILLKNGATKMIIGVLKDNHKARAVYEKLGGVLDDYEQPYIKFEESYDEVFYKFEPLEKFVSKRSKPTTN